MKSRGSYDRSDYAWSTVLRDAANFLMDKGAGDRPLVSFQEIAQAVRNGSSEGDLLRAAFQVEGHQDKDRGAEILANEALKILKRSELVIKEGENWKWNIEKADRRKFFTAHGRKIPLVPKEERAEQRDRALIEAQFITPEHQLPARKFDPDTPENKALLVSLRTFGYDKDFPILVDEDGIIVSGWGRAAACELVGIDWHDHTRTIKLAHSGPTRNIERTGKAVRANIGTGLSLATRKALAKKMRLEGNTTAEIAEAFGVSVRTVRNDVKPVVGATVAATMDVTRPSERELVSLCMEGIEAHPGRGQNFVFAKIRERGFGFDEKKARAAFVMAKSRLATKAPEPVPVPPAPETYECFVLQRYKQERLVADHTVLHQELVEEWEE